MLQRIVIKSRFSVDFECIVDTSATGLLFRRTNKPLIQCFDEPGGHDSPPATETHCSIGIGRYQAHNSTRVGEESDVPSRVPRCNRSFSFGFVSRQSTPAMVISLPEDLI